MNIFVSMRVNANRDMFIPPEVASQIESMGNTTWNTYDYDLDAEELKQRLKNADVCITGWGSHCFDRSVLEGNDSLKLVAHTGGSVASIVSDYMFDRGIKVVSGNKLYAEGVAEGVIAYTLAALRDIPMHSYDMQRGQWNEEFDKPSEGLLGKDVGLVGFGAVAKFLAGMLKVFKTRVKVYDPFTSDAVCAEYGVTRVDTLEEIFTTSKIISIHVAKTPETYHMIDKRLLQMIPDGTLLVNTARGSILNEAELAEELKKGRFKAVLDVYEEEPLPADSKLRGLDNVILMPHMAGPTADNRKVVTMELLKDIQRFFKGEPLEYEIGRQYAMSMTR